MPGFCLSHESSFSELHQGFGKMKVKVFTVAPLFLFT